MIILIDLFGLLISHLFGDDREVDFYRLEIETARKGQQRANQGPQELPRFNVKALEAWAGLEARRKRTVLCIWRKR